MIQPSAFDPARHKIGLFSPSSDIAGFPRRLDRAVCNLSNLCQGVVLAAGATDKKGGNAGSVEARIAQIQSLLDDPDVGLLMATTGGYGCFGVLTKLDLAAVARAGKPIVGSSDISTLLMPLTLATGLVTFHGPMALPDFGEAANVDFSWHSLLAMVAGDQPPGTLAMPTEGSDTFRFWDRDDGEPPQLFPLPPPVVVEAGSAEGMLLGGNVDALIALAGSRFAPPVRDCVIALEAAFGSWEKLERDLLSLEASGLFDGAAGLIFGRLYQVSGASEANFHSLLSEIAVRHRLPCLAGLSLGHSMPVMTLPFGVNVRLNTKPLRIDVLGGVVG